MNKTVKTIAWICLVLGIMGTALDVTAFAVAKNAFADRQAKVEEFREQIESGEAPLFKNRQDSGAPRDADGDRDGFRGSGPPADGGNYGGKAVALVHGAQIGRRPGGQSKFGLPLFALALGPVLLVVGLVTLIVNREPSEPKEEIKTTSGKKAKKTE